MVRDVAFATSRKFIWDVAVQLDNNTACYVLLFKRRESALGRRILTVANTLKTFSKHTIEYPYPVAISVHAASIGMEYPMICFNFRTRRDGTDATKWGDKCNN